MLLETLCEYFPNISRERIESVIEYINDEDGDEDPEEFKLNRAIDLLLEDTENAGPSTSSSHTSSTGDSTQELISNILYQFPDACVNYVTDHAKRIGNYVTICELFESEGYTKKDNSVDLISARLIEMLPKYDPSYLQQQANKLVGSTEEEIAAYVNEMLDKKQYPTIEEFQKKEELRHEMNRYTAHFDFEEFLREFPDPFRYFEHNEEHSLLPKDQVDDDLRIQIKYARTALYNMYRYLRFKDIDRYMNFFHNNIIKTCDRLDLMPKAFSCAKPLEPLPTCSYNNMLLFKELAFVKFRSQLKRYIDIKMASRSHLLEEARRANVLETCQTCYFDELIPEEVYFCMGSCAFCKDCVKKGTEVLIGEGKLNFPCFNNCGNEFSMRTLQMVLDHKIFYRLEQRKQIDDVRNANVDGFETCPFCDFGTVVNPEDKIFQCKNSECGKDSCRQCRHVEHMPLRCNEIEYDEDVKLRTYIENKMSEALIRSCQQCSKPIVKESGCNKITCSCGTTMCYVCGASGIAYPHFGTICPLHSDENTLHIQNVRDGARKAKMDLGVDKNPTMLKFDPERDM